MNTNNFIHTNLIPWKKMDQFLRKPETTKANQDEIDDMNSPITN